MNLHTARFGDLQIGDEEVIRIPNGVLGFPDRTRYVLVDSGDDTLVLWLQSLEDANLAFPLLEPKIFYPTYSVRLTPMELRDLKLESVNQSVVFSILTITEDVTAMTANLKAPIVVNLKEQIARQVVLSENEYGIKHSMFKELRAHLITIQSQRGASQQDPEPDQRKPSAVRIPLIPPSLAVKAL